SSRPSSSWSSTSRPPTRSASPCRNRSSPAPTRLSNDRGGRFLGRSADPRLHVKACNMSWSRPGDRDGRRGYHHGNLREALIRAALDLIAEKGQAGFTFADAARSAGVSSAAPYRHFRDRQALLADVARRGFELFEERLDRAWNAGRPDPIASLFARAEGGRRKLPMSPEELLEAGVLVYLRGLRLIDDPPKA